MIRRFFLKKPPNKIRFFFVGFPCGSAGKESTCIVGDLGSTHGLGRSPGERKGYPLQYSGLENSKGLQTVRHDWVTFTFLSNTGWGHHWESRRQAQSWILRVSSTGSHHQLQLSWPSSEMKIIITVSELLRNYGELPVSSFLSSHFPCLFPLFFSPFFPFSSLIILFINMYINYASHLSVFYLNINSIFNRPSTVHIQIY